MIPHPFVFVLWTDAATHQGWVTADEDTLAVEEAWSSGWLLHRSRAEVKLASDMGMDGTRNRRISIPMGMVVRIHQDRIDGPILYERKVRRGKKVPPEAPAADSGGKKETTT